MVRNFTGIQFESIRKLVDDKINTIHDELSNCFYQGLPFRTFGVLTKTQFDRLHGLLFRIYDVLFHEENIKQPIAQQIPEAKYRYIYDAAGIVTLDKYTDAKQAILQLKNTLGVEITV